MDRTICFTVCHDYKFSIHDIQVGDIVKIVRDPDLYAWFVYHPASSAHPILEWTAEYVNFMAGRKIV